MSEKKTFEPLPAGDYLVRMNRAEIKPCRNGKMLSAGFEVVTGNHKGRLVFENFLIEHSSEKAEKIGRERLTKYLQAVGVEEGLDAIGNDFTQVENYTEIPFTAGLKVEGEREYQKDGETRVAAPSNKISSFKKR